MQQEVVKVGVIQMTCGSFREHNLEKTVCKIKEAASRGAQIICLQEIFSTLYFCHEENHTYFDWAEPVPGPSVDYFSPLAKSLGVVLILSLFEKRAPGLYHNTAAVLDADGTYLGKYRKTHIPDDPGFYEKFYFAPGDTGYQVFKTRYAKIGVLICWDQWYPEAARITSLMGAEILFYPTAIGWDMKETSEEINLEQLSAWKTIQQSHAIANGVHVVSVNRVGEENGTRFWGHSFVANPFGTLLCEGSSDQEEVLVQSVHLNDNELFRRVWPFLRDRRPDTYSSICSRYIDSHSASDRK